MLYSVIDIGSNTVKIAVLDGEKIFSQPIYFKAAPLSLRSKVENGKLKDSAVEELCTLLGHYLEAARKLTPNPPIAFATASLRGLENAGEVLSTVKEKTGLEITLITGETEARYSFLGARGSFPVKAGISVDLGGGSTEILSFRKNNIIDSVSLPFGCLTLYQRFFEHGFHFDACCQFVRKHLKEGAPALHGNSILLSGGSAKAVLKYKNMLENKKCFTVGTNQFKRIKRHFEHGDPAQKEKIEAVLKDRFRLIPPALAVFSQIAAHYGKEQVFVCRNGVREGCLYEYLEKNKKN